MYYFLVACFAIFTFSASPSEQKIKEMATEERFFLEEEIVPLVKEKDLFSKANKEKLLNHVKNLKKKIKKDKN